MDPNNPLLPTLAKYAIAEHNRLAKTSLVFDKAFGGRNDRFFNHYIVDFFALNGAVREDYEASVYWDPILILPFSSSSAAVGGGGGWTEMKDVNDPHVKEIGKFAVEEHNKEAKTSLIFKKVISGRTKVVSGKNYKFILSAGDKAAGSLTTSMYQAIVWEKPWLHYKNLTSFKSLLKA
ncbi:multicystatin-like [Rutidosis leptorrhynchoides]|uniref:multicystatin-like n=1 Tax=Rutidosis leptorrhynchoides TaxID=125765 RepID=UPI003A99E06A